MAGAIQEIGRVARFRAAPGVSNGTLERGSTPIIIRNKLPEFIFTGDFGYASGRNSQRLHRVWFKENFAKTKSASTPMCTFCCRRWRRS